jgi:hypothetical protein
LTLEYRKLDRSRNSLTFGSLQQRDMVPSPNCFTAGQPPNRLEVIIQASTHALHTDRINLSPFTKDFRVWGALNENQLISLRLPSGGFSTLSGHSLLLVPNGLATPSASRMYTGRWSVTRPSEMSYLLLSAKCSGWPGCEPLLSRVGALYSHSHQKAYKSRPGERLRVPATWPFS